jgi:hypothetical protein
MNAKKLYITLGLSGFLLMGLSACQINVLPDVKTVHAKAKPEFDRDVQHVPRHRMNTDVCKGQAAGSKTQMQWRDQTITGQCQLVFIPESPTREQRLKHREHWQSSTPKMRLQKDEILTDEKRASLVKEYDQRLIEQQARQKAISNACKGQSAGKTVSIQLAGNKQSGRCDLVFIPDRNNATTTKR